MYQKIFLIVLAVVLLIFGVLFVSTGATYVPFYQKKVISNVCAGNVELEGLTREEGIKKLKNYTKELKNENITLYCNKESGVRLLPLNKTGIQIDADTVMDRALKLGHSGPVWDRWRERQRARENKICLPLEVELDEEKVENEVERLFSGVLHPPREARYEITPQDTIEIIPGEKGVQIEHNVLNQRLKKLIAGDERPYRVKVPVIEAEPSRTAEDIEEMGLKGLISSYSTEFDPGEESRSYNISVASKNLDGLLIPPEKEFSFNEVVGPRSPENGYKKAKIILNSELVDGVGGGVCQVSTTLYNAVLLAGLTVTERVSHSLPVNYVPLGRDATVAYNYIDLCFRNNTENHILIKSKIEKGTLTFKIYGNNKPDREVEINTEIDEVIEPEVKYEKDSSLSQGEKEVKREGIKGYEVSGEIIIEKNGERITKPLPESYYEPRDKIIAVGTDGGDPTIGVDEKDVEMRN